MAPYTHGHHESVLRSHRWRTAENSAGYLLAHLRHGTSILDVGCGPGTITVDLARRVAPGRVLGIDPAPSVVSAARADAGDAPVEFRVAGVEDLAGLGERFDVVHAHQVLQHLTDPVGALREMAGAARSGGLVAVREGDFGEMTYYPYDPVLEDWRSLYCAVARANDTEPHAARHLLAWAHAAGLREVVPSASSWCFATPEDRAFWGGLWADRMVQSAVAARALELGLATEDDLFRIAGAWRRWAEDPDGWFVVTSGEVLCRVP